MVRILKILKKRTIIIFIIDDRLYSKWETYVVYISFIYWFKLHLILYSEHLESLVNIISNADKINPIKPSPPIKRYSFTYIYSINDFSITVSEAKHILLSNPRLNIFKLVSLLSKESNPIISPKKKHPIPKE